MVHASDHHDALEVRCAGLLVVINSNCHALHGVRAEIAALKQWCISSGLQALSPLEASCQAFIQQSRMACDNALYVTRTLGMELARSRARPH